MNTDIDIDTLLRDTFLTVVELRQGTSARHGQELYRHCQRQVERVRERLLDAGYSQQDTEHITYAQCALLDETVLSRDGMDDGQAVWLKNPLQSLFFNTLQAGELLYERMKQVLQEPAPTQAVLTCFHRVLLLGFRGRYQSPESVEREQLISTLSERVKPFSVLPEMPLLNVPLSGSRHSLWHSPFFWLLALVFILAGVWWGLHNWLNVLVNELLPSGLR
ncbi:type VI secretion system protein TssL, short form [Salmonella enterica]|nr:type VI secretion system protein TssL, short form [Salmonella enterica]